MSADPVLDPAVVAELRRAQDAYGNPDFVRQLVALFLANAPARMDLIRDAAASRDTASLERLAHTLKTNCAVLGATRMAEACARMEAAAGRSDLVEAEAAFREAEAQLPQVLEAASEL